MRILIVSQYFWPENFRVNEIAEFLVDRYGEFVLYRPRFVGVNIILWLAPLFFLLIGAMIIFNIVKSKTQLTTDSLTGSD